MSTLNQKTGGAAIVAFGETQLGKPYSETGHGTFSDGHTWSPGNPYPSAYDCSGYVFTCLLAGAGIKVSNGAAEDQWLQHLGGVVPSSESLQPGDIGAFMGVEDFPHYAGHTGIVQTYNATTRSGTIINAYDTQFGVCVTKFSRDQTLNGTNGLGVVGFYRPVNTLPTPPPPPPPVILEDDTMVLVQNPNTKGMALVHGDKWAGVPNPNAEAALTAQGFKTITLTVAQFDTLVNVPWGQV